MNQLPREIFDQVIDHLHNDRSALISCSLTCRSWTPSSQLHIFGTVALETTLAQPLSGLLERSPHLALYITTLRISSRPTDEHNRLFNKAIPKIIPRLLNVRQLELLQFRFKSLDDANMWVVLKAFPRLRTIIGHCLCCEMIGLSDWFTDFIRTHPKMEKIELETCLHLYPGPVRSFRGTNIPLSGVVTPLPRITSLMLGCTGLVASILQPLSMHRILSHLKVLDILVSLPVNTSVIADVISAASGSLETFIFHFRLEEEEREIPAQDMSTIVNALSRCSHIRTVSIGPVFLAIDDSPRRRWIDMFLLALPAPRLEAINVHLFAVARDQYLGSELDAILETLSHPKFDNVQKIQLFVHRVRSMLGLLDELKAKAGYLGVRVEFQEYGFARRSRRMVY
ncbi:hypothetical protein JAAARDRAFT_34238 [Jaapia argillacea MUCL 33604]|uniref:F-box domain-containing protein n=1 Tax=Jaapia argillacea MUCL 33604 TaxID=933084 RepID=A0A067PX66_9AGAM|nr:hypothetical protein JAAARDRAFT_34238 [Jaapia argillacea MUCL 33604]